MHLNCIYALSIRIYAIHLAESDFSFTAKRKKVLRRLKRLWLLPEPKTRRKRRQNMPKTLLFRLVETFPPTKKKSKKIIKHSFYLQPISNTGGKHAVPPRFVKCQAVFPVHLPESRCTRFAYSGATSLRLCMTDSHTDRFVILTTAAFSRSDCRFFFSIRKTK